MSILTSVSSHMLNDARISALVGSRVYPLKLPNPTTASPTVMPAITYQLISEPLTTTYDGQVIGKARIQIDAWASSYKSARLVGDTLRSVYHGFKGDLVDVTIGACFRESVRDEISADVDMYRVSQDFIFHYKED